MVIEVVHAQILRVHVASDGGLTLFCVCLEVHLVGMGELAGLRAGFFFFFALIGTIFEEGGRGVIAILNLGLFNEIRVHARSVTASIGLLERIMAR